MKLAKLLIKTLIGLVVSGCDSAVPASVERSPFHSVVVRDGAIVATLPSATKWMVRVGDSEPRQSKQAESFTMQAGSVIHLYERHSRYQVTAQIIPKAGLNIESTFDARSFGDGVTKKKFFISAKSLN